MNELYVSRMGKVDVETVTGDADERQNYPAPIVLWNRETAAGVLYFSTESHASGSFSQKIDYLYSPAHGMSGRLKSMFADYPIRFSAHGIREKKDIRPLNPLGEIHTKDINGDGIDELILIRGLGNVEVYDREKRILRYSPASRPKAFEYVAKDVYHARTGRNDEMLYVASRTPYESVIDLSVSDLHHYRITPNYKIMRIGAEGIRDIVPTFADNMKPRTIEAVAALNKPGSEALDELILVTTFEDMDGYYLSRHSLAGKALDTPRKIYAEEYNPSYFSFIHVPRSNQVIACSSHRKRLYFITPYKSLNWIKTVKLDQLPVKEKYSGIMGQTQKNGIPVVMVECGNTLFAIDANGKFHTSMNSESPKHDEPVAFATIKPVSDDHDILIIKPLDASMDTMLTLQSRSPGIRAVSHEELEKAGERFLSDDDLKLCKFDLNLQYNESVRKLAGWYCKENKIPMPEIHSMDDIKKKLPGYYEEKVKESQRRYRNSLETRLFNPLEYEGTDGDVTIEDDDETDYKNKNEYNQWLKSISIKPELAVSIHHLSDGTVTTQKLADYYYSYINYTDQISVQDPINIRASGEHGQAFLVLKKKTFKRNYKPAYYTVVW